MRLNIPNVLTVFRILLTPIFIISLFSEYQFAHPIALAIFLIACITDTYDGYYARKYNQVTPEGKFLDPLADKILVSSAFISFAFIGLIEFWMVGLILFRDLFVTGLRMAVEHKGLSMVTSMIAKAKTTIQYIIIIFILTVMGLKGFSFGWVLTMIEAVDQFSLIYYFTFFISLFTALTGLTYLYDNRDTIQQFINENGS
ncbi:MAG: CDP-diacylglycerol--glycerol-3-phosphate 3-phosphatidyltransferase [bacterium TMED46]|nr:MAG: CDP-diacylglycerol--glycerol-3-phosphate 3-phosphatidyltransferase [bacterium TMED46]